MAPDGRALLTLPEFRGVNTNAPRGSTPAPELLQNVNLDRTGGWAPMYARSRRLTDILRVLAAGTGGNLFLQYAGGVAYWEPGAPSIPLIAPGATLVGAVRLMPDLLLTPAGYLTRTGPVSAPTALAPGMVAVGSSVTPGVSKFDPNVAYEFLVEAVQVSGAAYQGSVVYSDPGAAYTTPYSLSFSFMAGPPPLLRFYYRIPGDATRGNFTLMGTNQAPGGQLYRSNPVDDPVGGMVRQGWTDGTVGGGQDALSFAVNGSTPTAYHQGRVYLAPVSATYNVIEGKAAPVVTTDTRPSRVYFSEVIASAGATNLPAFSLVNFVDIPLRVSTRIIAIESVGSYLYVFGDREVLLLTGDPSSDARIENIGDSIGAVSAGSVRQLGGTVYWQSDSGVLSVQGGSVKEVGSDIRDQIDALGPAISSTVDFKREQYLLTDGATILVYHAREGGWTTRQVESGATPTLAYGSGVAYMQQGTTLYSLGGEAGLDSVPPRLTMRVRYPYTELGSWTSRKRFEGVLFGLDLATESADVTHLSTVDAQLSQTADTTLTVPPGRAGPVRLHTSRDGVAFSGLALSIEFTVSTQDSRAIVRPPLVVLGEQVAGEYWSDDAS